MGTIDRTYKAMYSYTLTKLYKVYLKTNKCFWFGSSRPIDEQNITEMEVGLVTRMLLIWMLD